MENFADYVKSNIDFITEANDVLPQKKAVTLYDALQGCVTNYNFKRKMGPTNYPRVVAACKNIKKKFKAKSFLTTTGKKSAQSMLSDMFFSLASQIEIDYKSSIEERMAKVSNDITKLLNTFIDEAEKQVQLGQYDNKQSQINIEFELNPKHYRHAKHYYYNGLAGSLGAPAGTWDEVTAGKAKEGVALSIYIKYCCQGSLTIDISPDSALVKE